VRRATRSLLVVFLLIGAGGAAGGCSINEQQEIELGRKSHAQFEKEFGGLYPDAHVQQYVESVGQLMARRAGRPSLDWQFAVVNSDQVNAFAVPGGYVYVTRGLLFRLSNEAQLAGVLGHESGHIAHRHSVKQMERAKTAQGLSTVAGVVGGFFGFGYAGSISGVVSGLALMSYSRGQEEEADRSGLEYMSQAGYNPRGLVQMMEVLQSATAEGGGKGPPQFLSTHPNPGNRIGYLNETIKQKYASAEQGGEYGEANFRQNVLARRQVTLGTEPPRSLAIAAFWCATCAHATDD
jgi:beta-barrel assembly-enhancing protease